MTELRRPESVADLVALVGEELGPSQWRLVDQDTVTGFADVTGDQQWIHTDVARAAESDFGGTIAHGLLTLSLGPPMLEELMSFEGFAHSVNYGYDKVRFPASVSTGTRVRMTATIIEVRENAGAADLVVRYNIEAEGVDKPVCVADQIARFFES